MDSKFNPTGDPDSPGRDALYHKVNRSGDACHVGDVCNITRWIDTALLISDVCDIPNKINPY